MFGCFYSAEWPSLFCRLRIRLNCWKYQLAVAEERVAVMKFCLEELWKRPHSTILFQGRGWDAFEQMGKQLTGDASMALFSIKHPVAGAPAVILYDFSNT